MPPKVDPYATPAQRRINFLLLIISAISFAILVFATPHSRIANNSGNPAPTSQNNSR